MAKAQKKQTAVKITMALTAVLLALTLGLLGYYANEYRRADRTYDRLAGIAFGIENGDGADTGGLPVDHAALSAINPDYVGWLRVGGTRISYPVVKSGRRQYYLRRDFYGERSTAGTVFMDENNSRDFSDTSTFLFGHNMHDGSMFAQLKRFSDADFFNRHKYVRVSVPGRELTYEIFAVYEARERNVPYYIGPLTGEQLAAFKAAIGRLALRSRPVNPAARANILTLSTCATSSGGARIIVHAALISVETA
ncbi:MAG TPA: class B sortase [Clostridiales bacterium]|nr:class B sortase [Clostridiales bacterium]